MGPQTLTFLSIILYDFLYFFFQDDKKAGDFHADMQLTDCQNYQTALLKATFSDFSYSVHYSNRFLQEAVYISQVSKTYVSMQKGLIFQ